MDRKGFAKRYAQAIFGIALEQDELDRWRSDLESISSAFSDPDVLALLESPGFRFNDKFRLLSEGLKEINHLAVNLVKLLVTKGKLDIMGSIIDEYQLLLDGFRGIEQAEATTAVPLGDKENQKLTEYLSGMVGKNVSLQYAVDPGLVGGIAIRIGGKLLDGSTRSRLASLKSELIGTGKRR
jgi:F-type H+-transporting ATPase subunit delta